MRVYLYGYSCCCVQIWLSAQSQPIIYSLAVCEFQVVSLSNSLDLDFIAYNGKCKGLSVRLRSKPCNTTTTTTTQQKAPKNRTQKKKTATHSKRISAFGFFFIVYIYCISRRKSRIRDFDSTKGFRANMISFFKSTLYTIFLKKRGYTFCAYIFFCLLIFLDEILRLMQHIHSYMVISY